MQTDSKMDTYECRQIDGHINGKGLTDGYMSADSYRWVQESKQTHRWIHECRQLDANRLTDGYMNADS
jgi:hypothetical protein